MALQIFSFEIIEKKNPSYSQFFCFESTNFGFPELSGTVWKWAKTEKILHGCWWPHQEFSVSGELLEYFIFKWIFFQKIQRKVLPLGIQLILYILWKWHSKIGPKLKKCSESIKNDTKAAITWVWNELRPKLFHQQIALNKGLLKKWC